MGVGSHFVVVRLAGHEYAVASRRIRGMMRMQGLDVTPVEARGALRYLVQFGGRTLPVFVPNRRLGLKERPVSARSCLLLIGPKEDPEAVGCALMVDSISRVEEISPARHRPPDKVRLGDKWRSVLDVDRLCAA